MDPLLSDLNVLTLSNNYEMQDDIDCHSWLLEIDLLQYLETFLTNLSNDGRVIRRKRLNQLRQQDLSSMNITNYVHQKMLMEHIRLVQKYSFHSPLRKKELKPITVTSSKILSFGNNEKVDKQNDKKKNKPKTSLVPTQEKMITSNSIAVDKKKQNRRRRSFDSEAWNSIINMRNRADQNANKADLLRDGVYSKSDFNESKVGSQDSKYETKQQQVPSNDGSSKRRNTKSNRRHSFNGIDPEEAVRKDMVSGERAKAKIYGNMALEYDIMLSHLHTLQGEILHKFKATINCEVASIFFVNHTTQELLLCGADFKWYKIPCGVGVCGYCFKTGENVNIPDAYADYRFNRYSNHYISILLYTLLYISHILYISHSLLYISHIMFSNQ